MKNNKAFDKCKNISFRKALDIGTGDGWAAIELAKMCELVTAIDNVTEIPNSQNLIFIKGDYMDIEFEDGFDFIWTNHVLEHQLNINLFLRKVRSDLLENGHLLVTVPPKKDDLAAGHVSLWNAGLLVYNLVMAGFDCADCRILTSGYNVSVLVKKMPDICLDGLKSSGEDIPKLEKFFPKCVAFKRTGEIKNWRWDE